MKTKHTPNSFYLSLDSNKVHAGLIEILRHFETRRTEEYMSDLVTEVDNANQLLFEAIHIATVKRSVYQEARELIKKFMAAKRYVELCFYSSDLRMKTSAEFVYAVMTSYDKPFVRMDVDTRISAMSTLLRDLATPEALAHIANLPEMAVRIEDIQLALDSLKAKRLEVDQANSLNLDLPSLLELKRRAVSKLGMLTDYLRVMAEKDPTQYGDDYRVVAEIISRINASRRYGQKSTNAAVEGNPVVEPE